MKKLLIGIFLISTIISCTSSRIISGEITAVKNDTVQINGKWFKVLKNVPKLNQKCTFIPTNDSSKVNAIRLKNGK